MTSECIKKKQKRIPFPVQSYVRVGQKRNMPFKLKWYCNPLNSIICKGEKTHQRMRKKKKEYREELTLAVKNNCVQLKYQLYYAIVNQFLDTKSIKIGHFSSSRKKLLKWMKSFQVLYLHLFFYLGLFFNNVFIMIILNYFYCICCFDFGALI